MSTRITAGGISVALPTTGPTAPTQPTQTAQPSAAAAASSSQQMWIITRGQWDDFRNLGVFAGTEDQVRALVGQLNESRQYVDRYDPEQVVELRGDPYGYESTDLIATATDVLGHSPDDGGPR